MLGAAQRRPQLTLRRRRSCRPAQISGVLGLARRVAADVRRRALSPAQITSLLGQAGAPATSSPACPAARPASPAHPTFPAVNALLAQVQALLGGGLPAVPGIDGLLNTVRGARRHRRRRHVDPDRPAVDRDGGARRRRAGRRHSARLHGRHRRRRGRARRATTPGTTTPARARPPAEARRPPVKAFTAYRATIGSIKVAKNRRSAAVTVRARPRAQGLPRGARRRRRRQEGVRPEGARRPAQRDEKFTVKLTSVAANRLKKKGGSLKVSARTVNGSLATVSKSVKVAKPLKKAARKANRLANTSPPDPRGPWRAAMGLGSLRPKRRRARGRGTGRARRPARSRRSWIAAELLRPRSVCHRGLRDTPDHRDWP